MFHCIYHVKQEITLSYVHAECDSQTRLSCSRAFWTFLSNLGDFACRGLQNGNIDKEDALSQPIRD